MHAGFSFSYSYISLLLRQPLSIKKSYAGAIQSYVTLQPIPSEFPHTEENVIFFFISVVEPIRTSEKKHVTYTVPYSTALNFMTL
jgi:hypothetical protein